MAINKDAAKIKLANTAKALLSPNFLDTFRNVLEYIIRFDDVPQATSLVKLLPKAMAVGKAELSLRPDVNSFYQGVLIKLQFIAFPRLDNQDIIDLVKHHFVKQFNFADYDIMAKLTSKLLNILIPEDKDKFKVELKAAILSNQENLLGKIRAKTVADWLKDYIASVGSGLVDNFKRAQYLVDLTKIKGMDEYGLNRLKVLFNFYETTKQSSLTPQGFEEEIPVVVDGKLSIFRRGALESVKQNIKLPSQVIKFENLAIPVDPKTGDLVNAPNSALEELRQLAASYPPGSLERKAVEEEMEKVRSKK